MTSRTSVALLVADLDVGGIQSMVASLARGLDRARFAPAFVCFDRVGALGEALRSEGFPVVLVPRRPGLDRTLGRRLRTAFDELGAGLVHAHNRTAMFYGVMARGVSGRFGLVYTEHDRSFPERLRVRAMHAVLSRRLDRVACVCRFVRDAVVATERFPTRRVTVIENGIPDRPDQPTSADARASVRAEFAVPQARALGLAIGHLTQVKDHGFLLRALARVPAAHRPKVVIAGDGPLRAELTAQRESLDLQEDVVFAGYRNDVDRLLKGADVMLLPSRSEGMSIALAEACARGVPIVATAVGGNPEVVDAENGRLIPHGDDAAFAAAIEEVVVDEALRARLGAAGRERFETRFRLRTMVARYEALYGEVCAAGPV